MPRRRLLVGLLCASATASYLCRVNASVVGTLLMKEFGLSQVEMGRVFSAFLVGYALFQIPGGALADRWGARLVLMISAWSWVLATILQACVGWGPFLGAPVSALAALLAFRFLLGIGEAPTFPGAAQGVARWVSPEYQGRANGLVLAAIGIGSALAPPLLSTTMVLWGWRAALLVSAIPALVVALAWMAVREEAPDRTTSTTPEPIEPGSPKARPQPLRSASFVLLTVSYTLQGYVGYIFVFWFYLYLVQERHFDLLRGAALSSMPWILSIVSIPLGGMISDRLVSGSAGMVWGRRAVPLIGLTASGVFIALGAHTNNAYLAAVYLALATAAVLSVEGPFWATMMEIAKSNSGTAGGIMNMGSNIGGLISPALTPILAAWIGWENALLVAAGMSILAAVLWLGIRL